MTDLVRVDDRQLVGADTLAYLGLDPRRPEVHALVLLCQRYRLDPLLGHAAIIKASGGNKAYITRDGMLEVAHRSGQLDGIVVDDQHETEHGGHSATVSVWRKDMTHPFTYKGGCGHLEPQSKAGNGAEMALARAERRALRRAFAISAYDDADADEPYEQTGEIQNTVPYDYGDGKQRQNYAPPQVVQVSAAVDYEGVRQVARQVDRDWATSVWSAWQSEGQPPLNHPDFTSGHAEELIRRLQNQPPEATPLDLVDSLPETVDEPSYRYDPADEDSEPF